MVGWSRRSAESARARRRYREWFESLPVKEQEHIRHEEEERWKKNKPKVYALLIAGFLLMFVIWPMLAIWHNQQRWQIWWNVGKIVSQTNNEICKEVEYCSPCSPIHYWHKKVFCKSIEEK